MPPKAAIEKYGLFMRIRISLIKLSIMVANPGLTVNHPEGGLRR